MVLLSTSLLSSFHMASGYSYASPYRNGYGYGCGAFVSFASCRSRDYSNGYDNNGCPSFMRSDVARYAASSSEDAEMVDDDDNNNDNSNNNNPNRSSKMISSNSSNNKKEQQQDKSMEDGSAPLQMDMDMTDPVDIDRILNNHRLNYKSGISKNGKTVEQMDYEPLKHQSAEMEQELAFEEKENALHQAILSNDWKLAAKLRDELHLNDLHIDDCAAVLSINSKFYQAFSDKSYQKMKEVWMPSDTAAVQCIHSTLMQPTEPRTDSNKLNLNRSAGNVLVGYKSVLESYKVMFDDAKNTNDNNDVSNYIGMEPNHIRLSLKGTTAWLTCDEEVFTSTYVPGDGKVKQIIKKFHATNVLRKVAGEWKLVHHHSTYDSEDEVNLEVGDDGASDDPLDNKLVSTEIVRGNGRNGRSRKSRKNRNKDLEEAMDILNFTDLSSLGLTGNSNDMKGNNGSKRIFMGSLSDLLSGSLDDLLGNAADDDRNNSNIEGAVIRISGGNDDDDENESSDEEGIDIDVTIEAADSKKVNDDDGISAVQEEKRSKTSSSKTSIKSKSSQGTKNSMSRNGLPKDALRQNCISALRRLCNQGAISQKQKRLLLTDIISCSAKGEFSMVEVAYELLCGEDDLEFDDEEEYVVEDVSGASKVAGHVSSEGDELIDHNAANEEDFADQCRVLANELGLKQKAKNVLHHD